MASFEKIADKRDDEIITMVYMNGWIILTAKWKCRRSGGRKNSQLETRPPDPHSTETCGMASAHVLLEAALRNATTEGTTCIKIPIQVRGWAFQIKPEAPRSSEKPACG